MADYGNDLIMMDSDLIFNPAGDLMTVADYEKNNPTGLKFNGYYNIIFSVFNRLNTIQGEIPFHPDYGSNLPLLVSKPSTKSTAEHIKSEFYKVMEQDPRIVNILSLDVQQQGNQVNVKAELKLSGKVESSTFIFPNFFIE